jgi:hypothetical protein
MQALNKRPWSVVAIGWFFMAAGVVGLVYHASDFTKGGPSHYEVLWVCLVRLIAVVAGVFVIRGHNWARWVLVIWIAYHVVLSAFHSVSEVVIHAVLLAGVAYLLFCRPALAFFRGRRGEDGAAAPPQPGENPSGQLPEMPLRGDAPET